MVKRLQVLMDDDELREIRRLARGEHLTTAEWVRQRLREAREAHGRSSVESKLAAIHKAYQHQAPAPDIDQMLEEIERGYLSDPSVS